MPRDRRRRASDTRHDRVGLRSRSPAPVRAPAAPRRFLGALLGLHRQIVVDGVRYKERSRVSLERSLGPRGRGVKSYEVRFPAGRPMTIHATETRRFADLMPMPAIASLRRAKRFIRPGARVLVLGSGTGAAAHLVASWTGPHGGVVALEHDHESVRFARRRYAPPSTSLERGGPELLAGEMDGAFDAVVIDQQWMQACEKPTLAWDEVWRVLEPRGRIIHLRGGDTPADAARVPSHLTVKGERLTPPPGGVPILVLTRIGADPPPGRDPDDAPP